MLLLPFLKWFSFRVWVFCQYDDCALNVEKIVTKMNDNINTGKRMSTFGTFVFLTCMFDWVSFGMRVSFPTTDKVTGDRSVSVTVVTYHQRPHVLHSLNKWHAHTHTLSSQSQCLQIVQAPRGITKEFKWPVLVLQYYLPLVSWWLFSRIVFSIVFFLLKVFS